MNKKIEKAKIVVRKLKNVNERNELGKSIGIVLQVLENSIPKEVIEKYIVKLEKQYEEALEENSTKAFILKCQIEILKEILEGK